MGCGVCALAMHFPRKDVYDFCSRSFCELVMNYPGKHADSCSHVACFIAERFER